MVRVDAGPKIGMGHAMRCLALAQAWKDAGGEVCFIMAQQTPEFQKRLRSEGIQTVRLQLKAGGLRDAFRTSVLSRKAQASWLVLDGYRFGSRFQQKLKRAGSRLMVIDDGGNLPHYYADLILNQNAFAREKMYRRREPYTQLLLGPAFLLIRREFLRYRRRKKRIAKAAKKILVTLGGGNPGRVGQDIFRTLSMMESGHLKTNWVRGVPKNMARQMNKADVALSASGSTAWELAFMGVPTLLIPRAENQRPVAQVLGRRGIAFNLGSASRLSMQRLGRALRSLLQSVRTRRTMSERGRQLTDGEGAGRVVIYLRETMTLRKAAPPDISRLWKWNNHPSVRSVSFSPAPIPWRKHQKWFRAKIKDSRCLLYIGESPILGPVGQARFDLNEDKAVASVVVDPQQQSRGHGSRLIRLASETLFRETPIRKILAYVKPSNLASLRAFTKVGYRCQGLIKHRDASVFLFSLSRRQCTK